MIRTILNPAASATRRCLCGGLALSAMVAGVLLVPGPAHAGGAPGKPASVKSVTFDSIVNEGTGQSLDLRAQDGAYLSGARVQQEPGDGAAEQHWRLVFVAGAGGAPSGYEIVNQRSGLALAPASFATADGTPAIQVAAAGAASELWSVVRHGDGYALRNVVDHRYLDVRSAAGGAQVTVQPGNGTAGQLWRSGAFPVAS